MTKTDAKKTVQSTFGAPPPPAAARANLSLPTPFAREKTDRTEQLNLRVPPSIKKRVRMLAARDDVSLSDLIIEAIALYEDKHGAPSDL